MKKLRHFSLALSVACFFLLCISTASFGQQKLIHYWHFNNFTGLSGAGSPGLITPIHANWSSLDSTKAVIEYDTLGHVSAGYKTYWDTNTGDTTNARKGAAAGSCLRVRNPSDSMQLLFKLPATGYKNLTLKFALEKSSLASGQGKQVFSYSVDGGSHWKTSGLSIPGDSITNTAFNLVSVNFNADTLVNNNANFVFRIIFKTQNSGTSGNNRFDNVTLEGDTAIKKGGGTGGNTGSYTLIHYWHFNNFTGLSGAGSPGLIKPIHANWSAIDSTKALIEYDTLGHVSAGYKTYWDTNTGDTTNVRMGAAAGTCLRVRNPSDSMQLLFKLPTTGYKNIAVKFALEKSSLASGQGKQVFDYSIDGGSHWKTSGLSVPGDSLINTAFNLVTADFSKDTLVNNNANFIFRILLKTQNSGSSGNNRFDNVTVEGVGAKKDTGSHHTSGIETTGKALNCTMYPNPANNTTIIATGHNTLKTITVMDAEGRQVMQVISKETEVKLNVSAFNTGLYFINVTESNTGKQAMLKMFKN